MNEFCLLIQAIEIVNEYIIHTQSQIFLSLVTGLHLQCEDHEALTKLDHAPPITPPSFLSFLHPTLPAQFVKETIILSQLIFADKQS
jgi:hypothetical protein